MRAIKALFALALFGVFGWFLVAIARDIPSPKGTVSHAPTVIPPAILRAREFSLSIFKIRRSAGGAFMVLDLDITNQASEGASDILVACEISGKSGTVISRPSQVIYDRFPAKTTKRIKALQFGPVSEQADKVACSVTAAAP